MRGFYSSIVYKMLPIPIQNQFVTMKGMAYTAIRRDRAFYLFQDRLLENEKYSSEELKDLQLAKLKELLMHAYRYVPFYKELFDRIGFRPQDLNCIADLTQLPILEKTTIRQFSRQLLATNTIKRLLFKGSTSGSTGSPLALYMDRDVIRKEHAFVRRQFRWAGCSWKDHVASFRGDMIVPAAQEKPPYWRLDSFSKELWFSSYHISEPTVELYIEHLKKFRPNLIYAYPSSISLIAQLARQLSIKFSIPSLRGILTSSETLNEYQRSLIQEAFNVRVFDWYGSFERVIFIGTCEFGSYHIFPDYGITELIPVEKTGRQIHYELVGTGFINKVMPLIRYRTGDIVTLIDGRCECGRSFPRIASLVGRVDDAIVTSCGRVIGRLDHVFKDVEHIRLAQIIQEHLHEVVIVLVPETGYSNSDEKKIISNLKLRLGDKMLIKIELVNDIPRLPNGKFKAVISKVTN